MPLVWLGAAILAASLAGCIAMIVLAARYPDEVAASGAERIMKMPLVRAPRTVHSTAPR